MTEADSPRAIKLAVVGHTNVGKPSLLRTLTERFKSLRDGSGAINENLESFCTR